MFSKLHIRQYIVVALFVSFVCFLSATERTEHKRLQEYSYTGYFSMFGSSSGYKHYGYRVDNATLIDTVRFYYHDEVEGFSTGTFQYYGSIQNTSEGKKIEYYVNLIGQSYPYRHSFYVLDSLGRVTRNQIERWSITSNAYVSPQNIYRHYNAAGYADSVYYSEAYGSSLYCSYAKRNFSGTMLQTTVVYSNGPVNWTPSIRYSYTYPADPVELPEFIRFDIMNSQSMDFASFDLELFCNPKFIPATIVQENWNGSAWVSTSTPTLSESISNNRVVIGYSTGGNGSSSSESYSANMAGDIIEYNSSWSGNEEAGSHHGDYTWDSVVAIADDLAPEIAGSFICAYPSPFNNRITIAVNGKDNAPADICIYNIKGQIVKQWQGTQAVELIWDGKDDGNRAVSSGIYLIKARRGKLLSTAKVIKL